MTPEEKASLRKILSLEVLEEAQKAVTRLRNNPDFHQHINLNNFNKYLAKLDKAYEDIDHERQECWESIDQMSYTEALLSFFELQEKIYAYQQHLLKLKEAIDHNSLFFQTHNKPEKKSLEDDYTVIDRASSGLLQDIIRQGVEHITTIDVKFIRTIMDEFKDRMVLLAPQNFVNYAIEFTFLSQLYKSGFTLNHQEPLNRPYVANRLARNLGSLYYFKNDFILQESGFYLKRFFGDYLNQVNNIFSSTLFDESGWEGPDKTDCTGKFKKPFLKKIQGFELLPYAEGLLVATSSKVTLSSNEAAMIYVHPSFINYLPPDEQLLVDGKPQLTAELEPDQSVKITMPTRGSFFTSLYDLGSSYQNSGSVFIHKDIKQDDAIIMTTYVYPISHPDSKLYIDQLAKVDFNQYTYCLYNPCLPENELHHTYPSERLQQGSLIPLQQAKTASLFIAECSGIDTDELFKINRMIHLFDLGMYRNGD